MQLQLRLPVSKFKNKTNGFFLSNKYVVGGCLSQTAIALLAWWRIYDLEHRSVVDVKAPRHALHNDLLTSASYPFGCLVSASISVMTQLVRLAPPNNNNFIIWRSQYRKIQFY
jgi:hypothetical protein